MSFKLYDERDPWEGYDPDPFFDCFRQYWADAKPEHLLEKGNE